MIGTWDTVLLLLVFCIDPNVTDLLLMTVTSFTGCGPATCTFQSNPAGGKGWGEEAEGLKDAVTVLNEMAISWT